MKKQKQSKSISQQQKILNELFDGKRVTALGIVRKYNILYPIKRINELIKQGYPIESEYVNTTNLDGKQIRFKEYWLPDEELESLAAANETTKEKTK